jgi:hypothetical protein
VCELEPVPGPGKKPCWKKSLKRQKKIAVTTLKSSNIERHIKGKNARRKPLRKPSIIQTSKA